jgi:hypothetical protein
MPSNLKYMPTFRARQQEILSLRSFDFGSHMFPLVEIVKAKDRINNAKESHEIYSELIGAIHSDNVFVDLPTYIRDLSGMQNEVVTFNRTVLSNIENRLGFYTSFAAHSPKIIPVVSTLLLKTGEQNTISQQFDVLKQTFPAVAIRTFTNTFSHDEAEIRNLLTEDDFLIYDIQEGVGLTSPVIKRDRAILDNIKAPFKIALRSAINTDIQNVKLNHGDIVYEADNSLLELYQSWHFNAFGDYVGIKKDDLTSGGTISPGFIFYNPIDNLYYGYKGDVKNLAEFESTIVPAVLDSPIVVTIRASNPDYLDARNEGFNTLQKIRDGEESGKSQAKFKRISMEHYLHCMRIKIAKGEIA